MPDSIGNFVTRISNQKLSGAYIFIGEDPQLIEEGRVAVRKNYGGPVDERESLEDMANKESAAFKLTYDRGGNLFAGNVSGAFYEITGITKPTKESLSALTKLIQRLKPDDVLSVGIYGLDGKTLAPDYKKGYKTAWVRDLNRDGKLFCAKKLIGADAVWWCNRWAGEFGVNLSKGSSKWLADNTQGTLSSAKQCIQMMSYNKDLPSDENSQIKIMQSMLSGRSKYNIFQLVDAALNSNGKEAISILNALFEIQEPEPLLVWAIGNAANGVLAAKRGAYPIGMSKATVERARLISGRTSENSILDVIKSVSYADKIVKGVETGDIKIALTASIVKLATLGRNVKIPTPKVDIEYDDPFEL